MEKKEKQNEKAVLAVVTNGNKVNTEEQSLQKEIEKKQAELEKCLAELQKKKKLSDYREQFLAAMKKLDKAEDELTQEVGFNSEIYKLKFGEGNMYREDEGLSINNRFILVEFIHFIRNKITGKIQEIEAQLIA